MPHICVITTVHQLDDVRVRSKFVDHWLASGFQVTWVGPVSPSVPAGARTAPRFELIALDPPRGRLGRLRMPYRLGHAAAAVSGVDVYYAPDPDSAPVAVRLARRMGATSLFDIHEAFHGAMLDRWTMGVPVPPLKLLVKGRMRSVARRCDVVIAVNDTLLATYADRHPSAMRVRSCAPSWFGAPSPDRRQAGGGEPLRLFHGKNDPGRGTLAVLRGIRRALDHGCGPVRVVMMDTLPAGGVEARQFGQLIDELGVREAIELRPRLTHREMPAVIAGCHAGLIAYGRDLGGDSLPNRIFEYMATGLAIVVPAYAPEMVGIVEAERCGILTDFEDPDAIAAAIQRLAADPAGCLAMGNQARAGFLERHNWEHEIGPLDAWIVRHVRGGAGTA